MKKHLASKGVTWCNSPSGELLSKFELLEASINDEDVCRNCLAKAMEKHLIVDSITHAQIKQQADEMRMSMKEIVRRWSDSHTK